MEEETSRIWCNANHAVSLVKAVAACCEVLLHLLQFIHLYLRAFWLVSVNTLTKHYLSDDSKYLIILCIFRFFNVLLYSSL